MSDARTVAECFYTAFARRDAEAMAACYADDASFTDPAFPDLRGEAVRDMWRMLCSRGKDLRIEHEIIEASAGRARVRWQAWYTFHGGFSGAGRKVHNIIEAELEVRAGKILRHRDEFAFPRWARQALGAPGLLLGWTPFLQRKVQVQAASALEKFRSSRR